MGYNGDCGSPSGGPVDIGHMFAKPYVQQVVSEQKQSLYLLVKKYSKRNYIHYQAKMCGELLVYNKNQEFLFAQMIDKSVKSVDLMKKILDYMIEFKVCKGVLDISFSKYKEDIIKQIACSKEDLKRCLEQEENSPVVLQIKNMIKDLSKQIEIKDYEKCLLERLSGGSYVRNRQYFCEMLNDIILGFQASHGKKISEVYKIIKNFYSKKTNVYEDQFASRLENLCKQLRLNSFQKYCFYLLYFQMDSVLQEIYNNSKHKLSKFIKMGLILEQGNVLQFTSMLWMHQYVEGKENLIDCIVKGQTLDEHDKLDIEDYDNVLQPKIKDIICLINNYEGNRPLNILFWGETGCGKSTLVNLLQNMIPDKKFIDVKQTVINNNFRESSLKEKVEQVNVNGNNKALNRMQILRLLSYLSVGNNFVLVMDECDDSLNAGYDKNNSWFTGKKELNELLQELRVPVIWITNHKTDIDSSSCRRFQYSVKFDKLNVSQRQRVWKKQIELTHTSGIMKDINIHDLAVKYELNPGVISNVLYNLKTLNPCKDKIEQTLYNLIKNHLQLVDEFQVDDSRKPNNNKYSIQGLNIKSQFTLDKIVPAINKFISDKKRTNLCLLFNGPPGTGKTEFAKYVARELKKELTYVVYGDLASCWVGETQHNIARCFDQAQRSESILFFDEADSLIASRQSAARSWQRSQTNEVLTRMQRFKGIFIASTNFLASLDSAAMRRFQFKLQFDYLDNEGKEIFYERFFGEKVKGHALQNIMKLTPGDFKAVRDRLELLDEHPTQQMIVDELKSEASYKNKCGVIGFK